MSDKTPKTMTQTMRKLHFVIGTLEAEAKDLKKRGKETADKDAQIKKKERYLKLLTDKQYRLERSLDKVKIVKEFIDAMGNTYRRIRECSVDDVEHFEDRGFKVEEKKAPKKAEEKKPEEKK